MGQVDDDIRNRLNRSGGFVGALPERRFVQAVPGLAGKSAGLVVSGGEFE